VLSKIYRKKIYKKERSKTEHRRKRTESARGGNANETDGKTREGL